MLAEEGAPPVIPFGVKMVGPVIYTFGTDEQKERFLPDIRQRRCRGARATPSRAPAPISPACAPAGAPVHDGDHYIVNGTKAWTTLAHWADWIFCLVRTDPNAKKQQGISFLLIDMKTPGVTVHPVITMEGDHHVNDVFSMTCACRSRTVSARKARAGPTPSTCWPTSAPSPRSASSATCGACAAKRAGERRQLATIRLRASSCRRGDPDHALEFTALRVLSMAQGGAPGPEFSLLKVRGTEMQQRIDRARHGSGRHYARLTCPACVREANERRSPRPCAAAAPRYFNVP